MTAAHDGLRAVLRDLTNVEESLLSTLETLADVVVLVHPPVESERGVFAPAARRRIARREAREALTRLLGALSDVRRAQVRAREAERASSGAALSLGGPGRARVARQRAAPRM